jgi:FtsH-binding integral membrane protein
MSNSSHKERYFTKLLIGFAALIGAVFLTYYAVFEQAAQKGDWYFWAAVTAFLLCGGIYFCLSAFIHKMKSDFNKRQQQRDMQRSKVSE